MLRGEEKGACWERERSSSKNPMTTVAGGKARRPEISQTKSDVKLRVGRVRPSCESDDKVGVNTESAERCKKGDETDQHRGKGGGGGGGNQGEPTLCEIRYCR